MSTQASPVLAATFWIADWTIANEYTFTLAILLIDDLQLDCLVHKFVDDTTLSELLASGDHESHMTQYVKNLRTWSQANKMAINQNKTNAMILGSLAKQP